MTGSAKIDSIESPPTISFYKLIKLINSKKEKHVPGVFFVLCILLQNFAYLLQYSSCSAVSDNRRNLIPQGIVQSQTREVKPMWHFFILVTILLVWQTPFPVPLTKSGTEAVVAAIENRSERSIKQAWAGAGNLPP